MQENLTPELRALASQAFQHQKAGRFVEAAQGYAAVLMQEPNLWSACYNFGLVYQHLGRMPEAAEMYLRAVRLNPQLAEAYNNLGNVLKALKNDVAAMDAYQRAIALNPQISDASYNLAIMLQARGQHTSANELFRRTVASNPTHVAAWDALYRSLLGLKRHEEAIELFLAWDRAMPPCPELVTAGLALCRPIADRALEVRYLALALEWPFADFAPEQFAPVLGMIQYFDVTREQLLTCYRRYDAAVSARHPFVIPMLPRRSTGKRLRIGYVSADFRRHVMGRWMLEVISKHDHSLVSIFLVSTCPSREFDAVTDAFRTHADGFADISELDDFAAAKSIAEADLDILVDLAGHTMAARPGIYAHRPARSIVTHLGYHGCLGLSAVDFKLTDRIADPIDAANFQIERPYALDTCVFPFVRVAPAAADADMWDKRDFLGKFVFAVFTNEIKLSVRCLQVWRRVLEAIPEALLLFSPLSAGQQAGIERMMATADIDKSRIAFLNVPVQDALWRARYRLAHAVLDTFPYAGGDTTLAALDMGVPVVTLMGERQSERVGASILAHLDVTETIAKSEDEFVAIAIRLARDAAFMAETRRRIEAAVAATDVRSHTRALEDAYAEIAAKRSVTTSMTLSARQFFQTLRDAMQRHRSSSEMDEQDAVAAIYADLCIEQPDYPPLLRVAGELAQTMGNPVLGAECASALLRQLPDDLDLRLSSAGLLIDNGAPADALNILPPVAEDGESDVRVLKLYTRAHSKLNQWGAALSYSTPAVALASTDVQVLFWHGMVLSHTKDAESALTFLNRALILAPDNVEAAFNAGVILFELGNIRDAETVFRRALQATSARATKAVRISAQLRLLQLLWMEGRHEEWISEGRQFISAFPDIEHTRLIESRIARITGELDREAEILLPLAEEAALLNDDANALDLIGDILDTISYRDVPVHLLQRLAKRFREAGCALYPSLDARPPESGRDQLHVGFLVDFSQLFVADFVSMLIGYHDPKRIRVKVYAISPLDPAICAALVAAGAQLVSVSTFDERRAAQTIQADNLDILVDVAAFGTYSKPGLVSCRPARIQLAMPGFTHPATTGEIDYCLSDQVANLDASPSPDFPIPVFLEGSVFPLLPVPHTRLQFTRAQLGLDANVPVFGVLAAAARLSPRCIRLWKTLADRVPNAVFFVCPLLAADREPIKRILLAGGVGTTRILMLPVSQPRGRDIALTGLVDIILDTMPGSDYFSARAAIHDAIPLVTIPGRLFEERVALSLLTQLGDCSTVAASGRDYVALATQLAQDLNSSPTARAASVDRRRALLAKSPLADMKQYVAHFEDALFRASGAGAIPARAS